MPDMDDNDTSDMYYYTGKPEATQEEINLLKEDYRLFNESYAEYVKSADKFAETGSYEDDEKSEEMYGKYFHRAHCLAGDLHDILEMDEMHALRVALDNTWSHAIGDTIDALKAKDSSTNE